MILNKFNIFDIAAIEKYFLGPEDVESNKIKICYKKGRSRTVVANEK